VRDSVLRSKIGFRYFLLNSFWLFTGDELEPLARWGASFWLPACGGSHFLLARGPYAPTIHSQLEDWLKWEAQKKPVTDLFRRTSLGKCRNSMTSRC
jgi:hypothetical protein